MDPIKDALTRADGIAARLLQLREQAGIAAKDLAAATGFFASKVSRIENGRQAPSQDDIRMWVRVCGADESVADELMDHTQGHTPSAGSGANRSAAVRSPSSRTTTS